MVECWRFVSQAWVVETAVSGSEHSKKQAQQKQAAAAAVGSLLHVAKKLPTSGHELVDASDVEELIRIRGKEFSMDHMMEDENLKEWKGVAGERKNKGRSNR